MTSITWPVVVFIALTAIAFPIIDTFREINHLTPVNNPFKVWHYVLLAFAFIIVEIATQSLLHAIKTKSNQYGP